MTVSTVKRAGALLISLSLLMVAALASTGCLGDDDDDDNRAPTAVITAPEDGDEVQVGEKFKVDGRDSSDPDGDELEFFWTSDLDGELTDDSQQIAYVELDTAGTHVITLLVVDPDGAEDMDDVTIEVLPENQPPVAIISSPRNGDSFSENDDITFSAENSYDPDVNDAITEYAWKIDGSAVSIERKFTKQLSYGPHTVELTVEDQDGLTDTADPVSFTVTNLPPFARIEEPDDGDEFFEGEPITFNASKSRDPEGEDLEFDWDFGDNSSHEDDEVVEHTYDTPGEYEVTLMVTDDLDQSDNETIEITIKSKGPMAHFIGDKEDARVEENITFDASGSTASGDAPITNYTWDFGDGSTNTTNETSMEHNWTDPGYYNVTLTVTDANNMTNETVMEVRIIPQDSHDEETNGQALGPGGETTDGWGFWVDVFHDEEEANLTVSSNLNTNDYEIEVQDADNNVMWQETGSLGGGDDDQFQLLFTTNETNNSVGLYWVEITVSAGILGGSASWEYIVDVRYS